MVQCCSRMFRRTEGAVEQTRGRIQKSHRALSYTIRGDFMNKWVAYLKIRYHTWRAISLLGKRLDLIDKAQMKANQSMKLAPKVEHHLERAREILNEVLKEQ